MSKVEHTPLPWHAGNSDIVSIRSEDNRAVARVFIHETINVNMAEANAALIVKAVNEYEELVKVLKRTTMHSEVMVRKFYPDESVNDLNWLTQARAALTKAGAI